MHPVQRRILLDITTRNAAGKLPYTTIVYSAPKKSGKTAIAGMFAQWFAFTEPSPNEVYVMANDLEQAQGRIFRAIWKSLWANPATRAIVGDSPIPKRSQDMIVLPEGTIIQALPNDYAGAAGSNHGLTVWSELWGYISENARRLWDELTPVPTRKNSVRLVETYAGFYGESNILEEIYLRMVKEGHNREREEYRLYQEGFLLDGEWYDIPLPVYVDPQSATYVYWDEEPRMPWQTQEYYRNESKTLRPAAFLRIHKNKWVSSESTFITEDMWRSCERPLDNPIWEKARELDEVVALDASMKKDSSSAVSTSYDPKSEMYFLRWFQEWRPEYNEHTKSIVVDLDETIVKRLIAEMEVRTIVSIVYDPYQLHSIAMRLLKRGLNMKEFPQTIMRAKADTHLYDLITQGRLIVFPSEALKDHVLKAKAKEYDETERMRLVKSSGKIKIDLAVALSMSLWGAIEHHREKAKKLHTVKFLSLSEQPPQAPPVPQDSRVVTKPLQLPSGILLPPWMRRR